jgi:MoxR-like ATPase
MTEAENEFFGDRTDLAKIREIVEKIRTEVGRIVIGQREMVDLLITALLADGHVLIEGVPGVAKTLTAKIMAKLINTRFSRLQFTPDLMPSDVLGTSVFNLKISDFEFKKGPVFANIILIDEINRAPAKTQAALFEVMEERQISIDGLVFPMEKPFMVLATQNPVEQEGTYRLPEAQLDRFLFKVLAGYPNQADEFTMLTETQSQRGHKMLDEIKPIADASELIAYRQIVAGIHIEEPLIKYIVQLVQLTRNDHDIYLGASPRASIAILNSSKAYAALSGRDFVTPEDIKFVAIPVLRHRIMLTAEKEMEGVSADQVIVRLIEKLEVPR